VKFPGEIRQTSGCSSKKFARERAKLKKKKEQTEVLEYWEVARNWDGCVPEISVALVCCVGRAINEVFKKMRVTCFSHKIG
jgi:hypothetical protein